MIKISINECQEIQKHRRQIQDKIDDSFLLCSNISEAIEYEQNIKMNIDIVSNSLYVIYFY